MKMLGLKTSSELNPLSISLPIPPPNPNPALPTHFSRTFPIHPPHSPKRQPSIPARFRSVSTCVPATETTTLRKSKISVDCRRAELEKSIHGLASRTKSTGKWLLATGGLETFRYWIFRNYVISTKTLRLMRGKCGFWVGVQESYNVFSSHGILSHTPKLPPSGRARQKRKLSIPAQVHGYPRQVT